MKHLVSGEDSLFDINSMGHIFQHCRPVNSLSLRERVGVRGIRGANTMISITPSSCPSPCGRRDPLFWDFMSQ